MPPLKRSWDIARFGQTLADLDPCCSLHRQLAKTGRQYLRLAEKVRWKERAQWRYKEWQEKYGADGTVIDITRLP